MTNDFSTGRAEEQLRADIETLKLPHLILMGSSCVEYGSCTYAGGIEETVRYGAYIMGRDRYLIEIERPTQGLDVVFSILAFTAPSPSAPPILATAAPPPSHVSSPTTPPPDDL